MKGKEAKNEAQILRLQIMLHGYANEETFRKKSKSLCFFCVCKMLPRLRPYATYIEGTKFAS